MLLSHNRLLVCAYIAANALDWVLTRHLIDRGDGYEANPVAAALLENHGWLGLAVLKLFSVGFVLAMCAIVSRLKPDSCRRLLRFACCIMTMVVGYSAFLVFEQNHLVRMEEREVVRGIHLDWKRVHRTELVSVKHPLTPSASWSRNTP